MQEVATYLDISGMSGVNKIIVFHSALTKVTYNAMKPDERQVIGPLVPSEKSL